MLDLFEELKNLVAAFEAENVEYALCGGMALTVHGIIRATIDIDIIVPPDHLERAKKIAVKQGFEIEAMPMRFQDGEMVIHLQTKLGKEADDVLMLDIIEVTDSILDIWDSRIQVNVGQDSISVVSKEGLIKLKKQRSSPTDLNDIKALEESE